MYDKNALKKQLEIDEDRRHKLYKDSVGKWTIGVGHNIDDKGLSDAAIDFILDEDILEVEEMLDRNLPWWRSLDPARQGVLMNMGFNMGPVLFQFKNTLASMKEGDYLAAAEGMKNSKWRAQVGGRADRLIAIMKGE